MVHTRAHTHTHTPKTHTKDNLNNAVLFVAKAARYYYCDYYCDYYCYYYCYYYCVYLNNAMLFVAKAARRRMALKGSVQAKCSDDVRVVAQHTPCRHCKERERERERALLGTMSITRWRRILKKK